MYNTYNTLHKAHIPRRLFFSSCAVHMAINGSVYLLLRILDGLREQGISLLFAFMEKLECDLQDTYALNQMGTLSQFPLHRPDLLETTVVNVPMVRHMVRSPRTTSRQAVTWVRKPSAYPPSQANFLFLLCKVARLFPVLEGGVLTHVKLTHNGCLSFTMLVLGLLKSSSIGY